MLWCAFSFNSPCSHQSPKCVSSSWQSLCWFGIGIDKRTRTIGAAAEPSPPWYYLVQVRVPPRKIHSTSLHDRFPPVKSWFTSHKYLLYKNRESHFHRFRFCLLPVARVFLLNAEGQKIRLSDETNLQSMDQPFALLATMALSIHHSYIE